MKSAAALHVLALVLCSHLRAVRSASCNQDGTSYAYNETVTGTARSITTNHCPNHPYYNLNANKAVDESRTYTVPAMPVFVGNKTAFSSASAYIDLSETNGSIGVLFNAAQLYSPYAGPTYGPAVSWFTSATYVEGNTFDQCGCHSSSASEPTYHCNVPPSCLLKQLGQVDAAHSPQIGWAFDGFPVYGPRGSGGVMMQACSITGGTYGVDVCTDDCGGYYLDDGSIDGFVYRYHVLGDYNDGKSCDVPSCPSPDWKYYPHTAVCFRGCCPSGVSCHDSVPSCPVSSTAVGYTSNYTAEVPTVNGLSIAAGLPRNRGGCACGSIAQGLYQTCAVCDGASWLNSTCELGENDCPLSWESLLGTDERQDEEGAKLVYMLLGFSATSFLLTCACCLTIWHLKVDRAKWPFALRGSAGLVVFLCVGVPVSAIFISLIMGGVLAAGEGWGFVLAFEYIIGNALGMQDPLTHITPESDGGKVLDLVISVWTMLVMTSAMGLAARMGFFLSAASGLPGTASAFLETMFILIPFALFVMGAATGGLMAAVEGWTFLEGFFYMSGSMAGVPLTDKAIATAFGAFCECIFIAMEVTLGGAIIGVVGAHPCMNKVVIFLEGRTKSGSEPNSAANEGELDVEAAEVMKSQGEDDMTQDGSNASSCRDQSDGCRPVRSASKSKLWDQEAELKEEELENLQQERDELEAALRRVHAELEAAHEEVAAQRAAAELELQKARQAAREEIRKEIDSNREEARKDWKDVMRLLSTTHEEASGHRREEQQQRDRLLASVRGGSAPPDRARSPVPPISMPPISSMLPT